MARVYTFRGKTIEELQKLSVEEFAKMLTSTRRRSLLRMKDNEKYVEFYQKVKEFKEGKRKKLRTHLREAIILPNMVGLKIGVYNGKEFVDVMITPERVGYRLGDFSIPIQDVKHSGPGVGATRSSKYVPLK